MSARLFIIDVLILPFKPLINVRRHWRKSAPGHRPLRTSNALCVSVLHVDVSTDRSKFRTHASTYVRKGRISKCQRNWHLLLGSNIELKVRRAGDKLRRAITFISFSVSLFFFLYIYNIYININIHLLFQYSATSKSFTHSYLYVYIYSFVKY